MKLYSVCDIQEAIYDSSNIGPVLFDLPAVVVEEYKA